MIHVSWPSNSSRRPSDFSTLCPKLTFLSSLFPFNPLIFFLLDDFLGQESRWRKLLLDRSERSFKCRGFKLPRSWRGFYYSGCSRVLFREVQLGSVYGLWACLGRCQCLAGWRCGNSSSRNNVNRFRRPRCRHGSFRESDHLPQFDKSNFCWSWWVEGSSRSNDLLRLSLNCSISFSSLLRRRRTTDAKIRCGGTRISSSRSECSLRHRRSLDHHLLDLWSTERGRTRSLELS